MTALRIAISSLLAGLCLAASPALAGSLTVRVIDDTGHPVADAVVTLRPDGAAAPRPRVEGAYRVTQQNTQFHPFVSVVPVGATVAFPNLDPFRHHVYSFSSAKRFELRLYARDQTRSVTFDQAGIIAIGCNIHDSMSAFIYVTDTVWTARTGGNGVAVFRDTPQRAYGMQVWHPYLRAPGGTLSRHLNAGSDRAETISVRLRPAPMHGMGGY